MQKKKSSPKKHIRKKVKNEVLQEIFLMKGEMSVMKQDISVMKQDISAMQIHFDKRFEEMRREFDKRFEETDRKFDMLQTSVDAIVKITLETRQEIAAFLGLYKNHDTRIEKLETDNVYFHAQLPKFSS